MPDKMTDSEIIKALECCAEQKCWECPNEPKENKKGTFGCSWEMMLAILDLINRLQAENERLKGNLEEAHIDIREHLAKNEQLAKIKSPIVAKQLNAENINIAHIKAEAYKEFVEKVCDEITDAIISNGKVIKERVEKHSVNRLEDNFCCTCDGKIRALGGIEYFIKNLLKEKVGAEND